MIADTGGDWATLRQDGERLQLWTGPRAGLLDADGGRNLELAERLDASGAVLVSPEPADLARLCREVADSGAEAVAICLLFSWLDDRHERAAARAPRTCLLYTSPSPRDGLLSRMPSSA